jgi:TonB family protein
MRELWLALTLWGCATTRSVNAEPELLVEARPRYEDIGVSGPVAMRVGIDPAGRVSDVRVLTSPGSGLGGLAREAMKDFLFRPALVGGRPISSRMTYRITFCSYDCGDPPPQPDTLSHADVVATIEPRLPAIDACIAAQVPPVPHGIMTLVWFVKAHGAVHCVSVEGASLAPTLAQCLAAEARTWRFRAHELEDTEPLSFPIVF